MRQNYQLSCESTVDMPFSYVDGRGLSVLFYSYTVDGVEYVDDMGRDSQALPRFYQFIADGKVPKTSQVNTYTYCEYFRALLAKGDVFHIAFGSGMTPSVNNAREAAEMMRQEFPDRKLVVVDSYCSSSGYGLFVDEAADQWDNGATMDELQKWCDDHCMIMHHQIFTTDIQYFRRSGRMSGPTATIASILNICPILRLNIDGRIIAYDKVRGKKAAMKKIVDEVERFALDGTDYHKKIFLSHANVPEDAAEVRQMLLDRFPHVEEVRIHDIGTIIAAHCGPGTVAVYFWGKEPRPE